MDIITCYSLSLCREKTFDKTSVFKIILRLSLRFLVTQVKGDVDKPRKSFSDLTVSVDSLAQVVHCFPLKMLS